MSFADLGLTPELLRAVAAQGYTDPTPVQAQSIPLVLARRDLLAGAQTGTGKTAAFVLPILQLLNGGRPQAGRPAVSNGRRGAPSGLPIRCLVLTPTRELALQVEESVRTYGAERPVRSTTIYGGVGFQPQVKALRGGPEIVVATPGRLLDHAGQGTIDLRSVEILVLDEADRMLDMGFIRDIRRILELVPEKRQNLLFSATFSDEIRELAATFLTDPAYVQIARRNAPIELVRQTVYAVDRERKRELLSHLVRHGKIDRALVFTRTKHGANRLAEQLERDGIAAAAIHGNKSQGQRVRALDDFKAGRVGILVATEIASRGLDIDGLPHVVNFELPMVASDYVHRIGRTGRAGMEGAAISLVCVDEADLLRDIESLLRQPIKRETVPGFEVDRSIRPEPLRRAQFAGRSGGLGRAPASRMRPDGLAYGSGRFVAGPPAAAGRWRPDEAPARRDGRTPPDRFGGAGRAAGPAGASGPGRPGRSSGRPESTRPSGPARPADGSRHGSDRAPGRRPSAAPGSGIGYLPAAPGRPRQHSHSADRRPAAMPGERLSGGRSERG